MIINVKCTFCRWKETLGLFDRSHSKSPGRRRCWCELNEEAGVEEETEISQRAFSNSLVFIVL